MQPSNGLKMRHMPTPSQECRSIHQIILVGGGSGISEQDVASAEKDTNKRRIKKEEDYIRKQQFDDMMEEFGIAD